MSYFRQKYSFFSLYFFIKSTLTEANTISANKPISHKQTSHVRHCCSCAWRRYFSFTQAFFRKPFLTRYSVVWQWLVAELVGGDEASWITSLHCAYTAWIITLKTYFPLMSLAAVCLHSSAPLLLYCLSVVNSWPISISTLRSQHVWCF